MSIGRPFADPSGDDLAEDEAFVRTQFASIAELVEPTQPRLVSGGLTAGAGLRRRRRVQQGLVAAVVAVVLVGGGVVGVRAGLFSNDATPPSGQLTELRPATPRGLAAAAIAALPDGVVVTGNKGILASGKAVEADLTVTSSGHTYELAVAATLPSLLPQTCTALGLSNCRTETLPDGSRLLSFTRVGGDVVVEGVVLERPDQVVFVFVVAPPSHAQLPDMPTEAQLRAIATNGLVGLQTSAAMNEAGLRLEHFTRGGDIIGVGSDGSLGSSGSSSGKGQRLVSPPGSGPSTVRPSKTAGH